jgi:hypothetical protein
VEAVKTVAIFGGISAMLASTVAAVPVDPQSLEAVGKWPLTVVLGGVCCFCVYLMYRQGADYRQSIDKVADALKDLSANLAQRPCIRDPKND